MTWTRCTRAFLQAILYIPLFIACNAWAAESKTFKNEELDQMLAPIALYPDSLLSQVLMASTYPADVAEAAKWSKANPKQQGDAAVKAVESKSWDPSVKSLAAFPQILAMMGEKPDQVQRIGDAFLAQPKDVMDSVQRLRAAAQKTGNLKTTEQQKVSTTTDNGQQVIIIEPAQPQTVYVPVYQPTVVYGTWWYPYYPPYYWPPPAYYYPGGVFVAGVVWGAAIGGIHHGLWGGCNWGHGSVNINISHYNNINVNNKLDVNKKNLDWNHKAANRKGVPYRDQASRDKFGKQVAGADQRQEFRGKDMQRDASRERARAPMEQRGLDPAKGRGQLRSDPQTRERAQAAAQNVDRDHARASAQQADRANARSFAQGRSGDNAFREASRPSQSMQHMNRGMESFGGARPGGGGRRR
jgi:hypothetical protein